MYPNYFGSNNEGFGTGFNQGFPPLNQQNQINPYSGGMATNMSGMKQNPGVFQKANDPMSYGANTWTPLKNPTLNNEYSDGSNSMPSKKLSYNSGVFIPSTTGGFVPKNSTQISESTMGNPGGSFGQPNLKGNLMQPGMTNPVSYGGYPQAGGYSQPNIPQQKYQQNVLTSTTPYSQNVTQPIIYNAPQNNLINKTPSPFQGQPTDNFQQGYYNQGANQSFSGSNSTYSFPNSGTSSVDTSFSTGMEQAYELEMELVDQISNLRNTEKREDALQELSKRRETSPKLATLLWYSVGTVAILLQELASAYAFLSPPNLSQAVSNKVCNVLGLLQCLALHPETRRHFLNAHIPLYLYPFLNTTNKTKPFENIRVTSLGVVGALVKGDETESINFLVRTEIIPLCLRIMKRGFELSRTVATFILQKVLLDPSGLSYICQTGDRFFPVLTVLNQLVEEIVTNGKDDQRLLRHVIRCYCSLSENQKANDALKSGLPLALRDPDQQLITDDTAKKWQLLLLKNLGII